MADPHLTLRNAFVDFNVDATINYNDLCSFEYVSKVSLEPKARPVVQLDLAGFHQCLAGAGRLCAGLPGDMEATRWRKPACGSQGVVGV